MPCAVTHGVEEGTQRPGVADLARIGRGRPELRLTLSSTVAPGNLLALGAHFSTGSACLPRLAASG